MVVEEYASLPGGLTTSPTPGRPRWRQSREENRKWETATAEERSAGMEDRMEGRVVAGSREDGRTWPIRAPLPSPVSESTRDWDPRQGWSGPTGPIKPKPVAEREDKAGLSGRLGPLPGRGKAPAAPRAQQPRSLWEPGSMWDARD